MNHRTRFIGLFVSLTLAFALLGVGLLLLHTDSPAVARETAALTEVVIALGQEPTSLYVYGDDFSLAAQTVRDALMDGPFTHVDFAYQTTLLTHIPGWETGDVALISTLVTTGSQVVAEDGNVVTLTTGVLIRPSGCRGHSCAIPFDGMPMLMDQMVVTSTLRGDVRWSDGMTLTVQDALFGQQIACDPDTPADKTVCDRTAAYVAAGMDTTVWTSLPGYWNQRAGLVFWMPLPHHVLGGLMALDILNSDYGRAPLGWGPFRLTEWISGSHITLERNPYYWRPGYPKLERVTFRLMDNSAEIYAAMQRGEIHLASQTTLVAGDYITELLTPPPTSTVELLWSPNNTWEHTDFGILPADSRYIFFDDPQVRRAVAYAIDRQRIIDEVWYGLGTPLNTYIPDTHPLYPPTLTTYPYSPTLAADLLTAAGWVDTNSNGIRDKGGQEFVITYATTTAPRRIQAGLIQADNLAAVGIQVNLDFQLAENFFANGPDGPVFGRTFDLANFAWVYNEPNCDLYVSWQIPAEGNGWTGQNDPGYANPAYDMACEQALAAWPDTPEYVQGHQTAMQLLSEDVPMLPIFTRNKMVVASTAFFVGPRLDPIEAAETWNIWEWSLRTEDTVAVGLVTDGPTVLDKSFNELAYQGLLRAEAELGIVSRLYPSASADDYTPNLEQCVLDGADLCIGVGFMMADAISQTAMLYPGVQFALVDHPFETTPPNLRGLTFSEEQAGYLAGTLAALMSNSGVVGAVGGVEIPPVQRFIAGYQNGARCAAPATTVLVTYTNTFVDPALGAQAAQDLLGLGADVIFGVGGATGNGAILTVTQSGAWAIGVDADQYATVFAGGGVSGSDRLLSSAMKRLDNAVFDTIGDVISDTFTSGTVLYTIAEDGVGLAPFHETDPLIPMSVRSRLSGVAQGLREGWLDVYGPCVATLGVAADLSGPVAELGWQETNAVQLALNEANAAGGLTLNGVNYTLRLAVADDGCDPTQALTAAQTLVDAGALAVVGHTCSNASVPAQPLYAAADVPMISPSSTRPDLTQQGYATTFRVVSHDGSPPATLAAYLQQWGGYERSALVATEGYYQWALDFYSSTFTALGGTLTGYHLVTDTADFVAVLGDIKHNEQPDVIFYADNDPTRAGLFSQAADAVGMNDVPIAWSAWDNGEGLLDVYAGAAGPAAEGDFVMLQHRPFWAMPGWEAFRVAYQAAGFPNAPDDPGLLGAFAYDAAGIVLDALHRADSPAPADVRSMIGATPSYYGVVGMYEGFDRFGDVIPQWGWIERYQDGDWATVYAVPEFGTERYVCLSGCLYTSVQAAVDDAGEGDLIKVAAGTYTGVSAREGVTQMVYLDKGVTIQGGYTTDDWTTPNPEVNITTLDAQGQGRVFFVVGGRGSVIDGLHITGGDAHGQLGAHLPTEPNGSSGGGLYVFGNIDPHGEKFTLTNNTIYGNTAWQGGGVYIGFCCNTALIRGNTFTANSADGAGGGLAIHAAGATFVENLFEANDAENGGGFSTAAVGGGDFTRCTFIANHARSMGGGLALETAATLHETLILSNTTDGRGGGIGFYGSNPFSPYASFNNTVIADNQAGSEGAGVFIPSGIAVHMAHTTLTRNGGGDGSGMSVGELNPEEPTPATLMMTNTIVDNQDVGVRVVNDSLLAIHSTLWHNTPVTVTADGGATVAAVGQVVGDPAFVDPASGDYHLGPASAARDAGMDAGLRVDMDGDYRPQGWGHDIGADEYRDVYFILEQQLGAASPVALPGATLVYTLTLHNKGIVTATNVVLVNTLDAWQRALSVTPAGVCTMDSGWGAPVTCPLGAMPSDTEVSLVMRVAVAATAPYGQVMVNQVTATAAESAGQTALKTIVRARLTYPLSYEPDSLDVNRKAADLNALTLLAQLMEAPYRYDPNGVLIPAGATGYTVSPDGRVYTVTLRSDALWSDGAPVTAQHYADSVLRMLDPATSADYAFVLYALQGAWEFNSGVITDAASVGVAVVDAHTLRFTLHDPAAFFPSVLATSAMYPVRLDAVDTQPFIGNGPYNLTEWVYGQWFLLDKNPLYHSAAQVVIPQILMPFIPEAEQVAAYEAGLLDVSAAPAAALDAIFNDPVLSNELRNVPWPGLYYLGLNTALTPTNDLNVRMALAAAIDRETLLEQLYTPWREAATSVIPPGIPGYQNGAVGYPFNPTQAQTYLTQAGYPNGVGFPGLELWAYPGTEAIIEAIANGWRETLNISVTVIYIDRSLYYNELRACRDAPGTCTYNVYRGGWLLDYGDAHNIVSELFHPDAGNQYTFWDSATFRQLIDAELVETNPATRLDYLREADRVLVEYDAVIMPVYFLDRPLLIKPNLVYEYPTIGGPRLMTWRTSGTAAPCYVRVSSLPGVTYNDLQAAIDAAQPGDTLKVAGTCTAVHPRYDLTAGGVVTQVAYLDKSLILQGGYTTTNWLHPNPTANPTTLDAHGQGRVLYITGDNSVTVAGLHITGGDATGLGGVPWPWDAGGGVYAITATVTLNDNRLEGNYSPDLGGGVFLRDGVFTLNRNVISANYAGWGGGALFWQSHARLTGNTLVANAATTAGGGIAAWGDDLTLNGDTLMDNMTSGDGGGLAGGAAITLTNTLVAHNQAERGGGLYVDGMGHLTHNTLVGNTSSDGSSIYVTTNPLGVHSTVALTNTILAHSDVGLSVTGGNTVTVNGILWYATPVTVSQALTAVVEIQNQITGDPRFAADGYHLRIGSAALDAGVPTALARDIDGDPRPYGGGGDLGADEAPYVQATPQSGATLVYTATQGTTTTVTVPPAAVSETVTIVFTQLEEGPEIPPELVSGEIGFELDAYLGATPIAPGFVFNAPVTVTLVYSDADVIGMDESSLKLYRYVCVPSGSLELCLWEAIGTRSGEGQLLDMENNVLTAWLVGFSRFRGMGASFQPDWELAKTYAGNRVAGTLITYTLTVTNTGGADATGVTLEDVVPEHLTWSTGGTFESGVVRWTFDAITASGGAGVGTFSAVLPCTASLAMVNDDYRVTGSAQGVTSTVGPPVSFAVAAPTIAVNVAYTPTAPVAGDTVTFTAEAATDGTPLTYQWNVGGSGSTITQTYPVTGTYTVTFTATDGCGYHGVRTVNVGVGMKGYLVYMPLVMR